MGIKANVTQIIPIMNSQEGQMSGEMSPYPTVKNVTITLYRASKKLRWFVELAL